MTKQEFLAQPTPVLTAQNAAIIEAVKAAGFVLKDEHGDGDRTLSLAGVAAHQNGDRQYVVALFTKDFSDYYCLNEIALRNDGPAVTRNNCSGIVSHATHDPVADLDAILDNINWEAVTKYPVLKPGQFFNVVLK